MRRVKMEKTTELKVRGIIGFMIKRVTPFGTGAKVDCPKEYTGKEVYLVITDNKGSKQ
jgi:putative transposon-encoded protein